MADVPSGPNIAQLHAAGALESSHGNVSSGAGIAGGEGGGMLPFGEQKIDLSFGSIDQVLPSVSMDGLFEKLKREGGAFGQSLTKQLGDSANYFVADEAKGQPGLKLETLGQSERQAPPTIQGDIQAKAVGMGFDSGGQSH
jgi:hypothetical protein